jgi:hypothetical protein
MAVCPPLESKIKGSWEHWLRMVGPTNLQRLSTKKEHQEAIFVSCIATTGDNKVEPIYLHNRRLIKEATMGRHISHLTFGPGMLTTKDWAE